MPPENSPPTNNDQENAGTPLKQIRTFQGDVAEALGRQKESLVSIQQTEAFKRRAQPGIFADAEESESRKNFFLLLLGSVVLIALGIIGAWYGYREYLDKTAPPIIARPANQFISPESKAEIDFSNATRESLISDFDNAVLGLSPGELRQVLVKMGKTKEAPLAKTAEFFAVLKSQASGSLVRAFDPLFMLGAIGENRFIIIKLASFEKAFPGMLEWEAEMAQDIGPLFSTAELMKAIDPASVFFKDIIIENEDVRLLELTDTPGATTSAKTVLLYSFLDNEMLIITESIETLQTLIERLIREKLSR